MLSVGLLVSRLGKQHWARVQAPVAQRQGLECFLCPAHASHAMTRRFLERMRGELRAMGWVQMPLANCCNLPK